MIATILITRGIAASKKKLEEAKTEAELGPAPFPQEVQVDCVENDPGLRTSPAHRVDMAVSGGTTNEHDDIELGSAGLEQVVDRIEVGTGVPSTRVDPHHRMTPRHPDSPPGPESQTRRLPPQGGST